MFPIYRATPLKGFASTITTVFRVCSSRSEMFILTDFSLNIEAPETWICVKVVGNITSVQSISSFLDWWCQIIYFKERHVLQNLYGIRLWSFDLEIQLDIGLNNYEVRCYKQNSNVAKYVPIKHKDLFI